jgi:soluble lytic murein transglycosylase-like protein
MVVTVLFLHSTTVSAQTVTVSRGDTVWSIAEHYHVAAAAIVQANHLVSSGRFVTVGEKLQIPEGSGAGTALVHHRVVPGDTLFGLARQYGEPEEAIAADNHLQPHGAVYLGTTLLIRARREVSTPGATASASPPSRYPPAVVAAAQHDRAVLAARSLPSPSAVRSLVVATARYLGVDASLALAVANQESGFQQRVVSDADAIGVMQVLPATARRLSTVTKRNLDLYDAADNVTAGVLLIRMLTRAAPLDQAIAGYYQGLSSVERSGPFADTKRYVSDVLALRRDFASGRR